MKKNNKGFTLIETIIAISIFSIVVTLGYKVINKSNILMASQQKITNTQIALNLINTYVNRDLEESILINDIKWIDDNTYEYEIIKKDNIAKYIIYKYKSSDKQYCDIYRVENNTSIELIKKQEVYSDTPFTISLDKVKRIYTVQLQYKENNNSEKISFEVTSRIDIN